jgi:A/G-specific adenine glycosylase
MELGATVCTPVEPRCADCPLQRDCIAFRNNAQRDIPLAKPRQEITPVVEAAIAIRRRGQYLLRQRAPGERWAGLWDFPRFELQNGHASTDPLRDTDRLTAMLQGRIAELTGLTTEIDSLVTEFTHAVTRYRIRLLCFRATCQAGTIRRNDDAWQWVRPTQFGSLALSVSGRRFSRLLLDDAGDRNRRQRSAVSVQH